MQCQVLRLTSADTLTLDDDGHSTRGREYILHWRSISQVTYLSGWRDVLAVVSAVRSHTGRAAV